MDVNNQTHKVIKTKLLHTIHNYCFAQHHFFRTNPLLHLKSSPQNANTKLSSPYYMNYSYVINSTYCKGKLQIFDPIKNYFLFSPFYAKTNRPILVPIEYLHCVEGGATNRMYGRILYLLYETGWYTSWTIGSRHQKRHKSSTNF